MLDVVDHHDLTVAISVGPEAKITDTDLPVWHAGERFDVFGGSRHSSVTMSSSFETIRCCVGASSPSNAPVVGGQNSHVQSSFLVIDHFDDLVARDGLTLALSHRVLLGGDARQHIA
jgi:hypothetical protein